MNSALVHDIPGIPSNASQAILGVFEDFPAVEQVVLYGSRAKGNFKRGSDIDLCILDARVPIEQVLRIEGRIDDLLLPWSVDLSTYDTIENADLRAHIDRIGLVVFRRAK